MPPERSAATRRHVAQIMHRLLTLAAFPARLIPVSPLPRGWLPLLPAEEKAKVFLYPDEDAALMACREVPLVSRVLYGLMAREGLRESEALDLEWGDLDLERGVITLDENKTADPRLWSLDPGVVAALALWRRLAPKKPFGAVMNRGRLAERFRVHLRAAGVDRPKLFERSTTRMPIRVHDLRATFVTLALGTGRTDTWVRDRTGHRSSEMVDRYRRAARAAKELDLGWLRPLNEAIPELAEAEQGGHAVGTVRREKIRQRPRAGKSRRPG